MARVLIVDDDQLFGQMLCDTARQLGHETATAFTVAEARQQALSGPFDVVLLDVGLPDGNGLDLIPEIRFWEGNPEVIIVTGAGDPDGAELAIRSGVWDYLEKTNSFKQISLHLTRVHKYREEKRASKPRLALWREGIVGSSPQLQACLDLVAQAALTEASVLITGESGTGKELFATAIHKNSPRAQEAFVVVDCAALPESLVEGILFGHTKGAFTGADRTRVGLIKQADGGTLFLDEIGDLPLSMQRAFLRVLQEHRFRPLGSSQEVRSDFRVIAATNRDLGRMAKEEAFRSDLLFRLQSMVIEIPPLRERGRDLRELASYYLDKLADRYQSNIKGLSAEFLDALAAYSWPGNVRELINSLESSLAVAGEDPILLPKHLPIHLRVALTRSSLRPKAEVEPTDEPAGAPPMRLPPWREFKEEAMDQLERGYIELVMAQAEGDIERARRISGLGQSRLYELLKKHKPSQIG